MHEARNSWLKITISSSLFKNNGNFNFSDIPSSLSKLSFEMKHLISKVIRLLPMQQVKNHSLQCSKYNHTFRVIQVGQKPISNMMNLPVHIEHADILKVMEVANESVSDEKRILASLRRIEERDRHI